MLSYVEEPRPPTALEERFVMRGVSWALYAQLRDSLDHDGSKLRLTYLRGDLEIMSPSGAHERTRSRFAHLIATWCEVHDIEIFAQGSTTYRAEAAERGLEPDESFSIGATKPIPDLAIEVVYSSFKVDKLDVYRGLGVREVWVWRAGAITVHRLEASRYVVTQQSAVLAGIDLADLATRVQTEDGLTQMSRAYRAMLGR